MIDSDTGMIDPFSDPPPEDKTPPAPTEGYSHEKVWEFPLHEICESDTDDVEILKILLSSNKIDDRDQEFNTPLHVACKYGNPKIVLELLRRKADIDARNTNGYTPLIVASMNDQVEVIRILINNGALIDYQTFDNRAALHFAASKGNAGACKELLRNGANPFLRNEKKKAPEDVAVGEARLVFGEYREGISNIWKDSQRMKERLGEEEIFLREFFDDGDFSLEPFQSTRCQVGRFFSGNEWAIRNYHRFMELYELCIIRTLETFKKMDEGDRYLYHCETEKDEISPEYVLHGDADGVRIRSVAVEKKKKKESKKKKKEVPFSPNRQKKESFSSSQIIEKENDAIERQQGYSKLHLIQLFAKTIRFSSISMSQKKWNSFLVEFESFLDGFVEAKTREISGETASFFEVSQKSLTYPKMRYLFYVQLKTLDNSDLNRDVLRCFYLLREFPPQMRIPISLVKRIWDIQGSNKAMFILRSLQQRGLVDLEFATDESFVYYVYLRHPQYQFLQEYFAQRVVEPLRVERERIIQRLEEEKTFKLKKRRGNEDDDEVFDVDETIEKNYSAIPKLFPMEVRNEGRRKFIEMVGKTPEERSRKINPTLMDISKKMMREDRAFLTNQKSALCSEKAVRTALIIGNSHYEHHPSATLATTDRIDPGILLKSLSDAKLIAELLGHQLGFETSLHLNTKYHQIKKGVDEYCKKRSKLVLEQEETHWEAQFGSSGGGVTGRASGSQKSKFPLPYATSATSSSTMTRISSSGGTVESTKKAGTGKYLGDGSISFFYYSGYGNSSRIYPVDYDFIENDSNFSLSIQELMSSLEESDFHRNAVNIVVLQLIDPFLKIRTIEGGGGTGRRSNSSTPRKKGGMKKSRTGKNELMPSSPKGTPRNKGGTGRRRGLSTFGRPTEKRVVKLKRQESPLEEDMGCYGVEYHPECPQFYVYVVDMREKPRATVDPETDQQERKNSVFVRLFKRLVMMPETSIDEVFQKLRYFVKNHFSHCFEGKDESYDMNFLMDDIFLVRPKSRSGEKSSGRKGRSRRNSENTDGSVRNRSRSRESRRSSESGSGAESSSSGGGNRRRRGRGRRGRGRRR